MDDRIRISDADRDGVTARLREHFAEGRLSSEELDERVTAALSAKTFGDLRPIMADLPNATPGPQAARPGPARPAWHGPAWHRPVARRGPRILPLAILVLLAALVIPGAGWLFFAFLKVAFVLWLVACVAGIVAAARFRRHLRRTWHAGYGSPWHHYQWRG